MKEPVVHDEETERGRGRHLLLLRAHCLPLEHCEGSEKACLGAEALVRLRSRSEAADPATARLLSLAGAAPRHRPPPNQAAAGRRSRRRRGDDGSRARRSMSQLRLKWREVVLGPGEGPSGSVRSRGVEGQRSQQPAAQPCPASTVAVGEWRWPFLAGDWPRALDASANVVRGGRRDLPSQSVRPSAPLFLICARVKTENMGDMTISRYPHRSLSVHAAMGERGWWKRASFPLLQSFPVRRPAEGEITRCTSDCCIWPPQKANRPAQPDAGARRPRAYQHARAERAASHLKSDDGALAVVAGCGRCCPGRVHLLGNGMGVDLI
jgi:hypothetical protein